MRYRQLPLDQIAATRNIRKTCSEEGMAELVASIERFGLLQPVVVFETGKDEYELVAGSRRYAACGQLGWDTIPAMITKSEEQAGFLAQLQENLVREDMSIGEELDAVTAAMQLVENAQREDLDQGEEGEALLTLVGERQSAGGDRRSDHYSSRIMVNQAALASLLGKSQTWVSRRLAIVLDLPADVRSRVRKQDPGTGKRDGLALNTAAQIAQLKNAPDTQRKLADKVEREQLTQPQVTAAVRAIKESPEDADAILAARADDSSFDTLTKREAPKKLVRATGAAKKNPAAIVMERVSHAYMDLLMAFDEDRLEAVEDDKNELGEARLKIADEVCYMRALLDRVIQSWQLEELCTWSTPPATDSNEIRARIVSLQIV